MHANNCFFHREQGFHRYTADSADPKDESGMTGNEVTSATLVNGFASGTFLNTGLASDSVTISIELEASHGDHEEKFVGTFLANINESGTASAGNGNVIAWSFSRTELCT